MTCTRSALRKKYARSVRHPWRKTSCSGRRANSRSSGMKTAEYDHQVQQKPVETQERPGLQLAIERHARPAEQRGSQRQCDADHAQDLAVPQAHAHHACDEGTDQDEVQECADERNRIEPSQLRNRQQRWVVKTEDRAKADRAECDRQHAGDPTRSECARRLCHVQRSTNVCSSTRGSRPTTRVITRSHTGKKFISR